MYRIFSFNCDIILLKELIKVVPSYFISAHLISSRHLSKFQAILPSYVQGTSPYYHLETPCSVPWCPYERFDYAPIALPCSPAVESGGGHNSFSKPHSGLSLGGAPPGHIIFVSDLSANASSRSLLLSYLMLKSPTGTMVALSISASFGQFST